MTSAYIAGTAVPRTYADEVDNAVPCFKKIQLTDKFWTEGVAIGDINQDNHPDVVAWPFWYEGPAFSIRHEIAPATKTFELGDSEGRKTSIEGYEGALAHRNAYSEVNFVAVHDFNSDGRLDVLAVFRPIGEIGEIWWYENPGRSRRYSRWKRHVVFGSVACENPQFVDLLGTGRSGVLCQYGQVLGFVSPGSNAKGQWSLIEVANSSASFEEWCRRLSTVRGNKPCIANHGLGYGDVDGDGRLDILDADGWWKQPAAVRNPDIWPFQRWSFLPTRPQFDERSGALQKTSSFWTAVRGMYEWPFGLSGAQIYVYDVNGDGLADVVSSLNAHGYGLAWFEQRSSAEHSSATSFTPHILMSGAAFDNKYGVKFSQLHGVAMVDVDGDGLQDIVTGKRFWAHGRDGFGIDPDSNEPAVIYWFRLVRKGTAVVDFVPYQIDDNSGIGYQIATGDLNGDGLVDIATSNKKGTFIFLQDKSESARDLRIARAQAECR